MSAKQVNGASAAPVSKKPAGKISRARTVVLLAVFLLITLGLFLGNGWGTLSSMGVGAIAYLCPLGALETMVTGQFPVLRAVISLLCVVAVVALIGRAFCAWVCPVPPLRRFFRPNADKKAAAKAAEAAAPKAGDGQGAPATAAATVAAAIEAQAADKPVAAPLSVQETAALSVGCGGGCASCGSSCALPPVGGKRDGLRFDSRHGVLLGALASSAIFGFPVFCLVCPVGLTIALGVGVWRAIFQQDPTVSLLVFAAILLVEVVFFRKWCHKLCPLGALMSLVGAKAPLLRPRVSAAKCLREQGIDCRACVKACPEQLDPHSKAIPECTKCGLCAEACPAGAISFRGRLAKSPLEAPAPAPVPASAAMDDLDVPETPVA